MGYVGSYMWQLRQKVGNKTLITATVDVLPVDKDGKVKLVYANHFEYWSNVGGHVELGDSWESAALKELKEEAGITANREDLELFATMSGAGRVYHYADGDTQPFTLVFLCRSWLSENAPSDEEEISKTEWLTLEDAKAKKTNPHTARLLSAYEEYLKTGKVQMVEE